MPYSCSLTDKEWEIIEPLLPLLIDTNDTTIFVLYENWTDQVALDAHFQQPYVKQVLKSYEETLAEPIEVLSLSQP